MKTKKIEYNGETYYLHSSTNNINCYINSNEDSCIFKDNNGKLLREIKADCAQNTGLLKIK